MTPRDGCFDERCRQPRCSWWRRCYSCCSGELVLFIGIDVQDFKSDARQFLRRYKANYVSVRDGGSSTYEAYGLTGLPETFHLDARGRVVAHTVGQLSREELGDGIAASVGEAP